jgi:Ca2+-binding EF-hand superfamily protein
MTGEEGHTLTVTVDKIEKMPELKENPFKRRICQVFSHDGSGNMTFDDFLDMLSVFSESAPRDVKVYFAFKIYDYNGDHFITEYDIEQTTIALTKNQLAPDEIAVVCDKVMQEANNDDDGKISLGEFQHVISRAPDFLSTFHVRI